MTGHPESVHPPLGSYSHTMEVTEGSRVLYVSGQVGIDVDGRIPADFAEQAELVWRNVTEILRHNGLGVEHIVKAGHYVTDAANLPAYVEVRSRWLGDARPASTLLVVSALAGPEYLVEVDVIAAV